jgi:hypothetical protein
MTDSNQSKSDRPEYDEAVDKDELLEQNEQLAQEAIERGAEAIRKLKAEQTDAE